MNERIKELMGKTLDSEFSHTWDTMTYEGLLQFSEKFAQLIVQECIDISTDVEDEALQNREFKAGSAATLIKVLIKKHFEIES